MCKICDSDAIRCSPKGLVYQAVCSSCRDKVLENAEDGEMVTKDLNVERATKYVPTCVGETARPFRMRSHEHHNNLKNLKMDSFILSHWMLEHGDSMIPLEFEFKRIISFSDSFSRQLAKECNLN